MAQNELQNVVQFMTKNKNVPIGDQQKQFDTKDYRELRKFFKHATSEEIRMWIISAMENNRTYTDTQLREHGEQIRQDYLKQLVEKAKEIRDYENQVKQKTIEVEQLNDANAKIQLELTLLKQYVRLPWYQRLFKQNPLKN